MDFKTTGFGLDWNKCLQKKFGCCGEGSYLAKSLKIPEMKAAVSYVQFRKCTQYSTLGNSSRISTIFHNFETSTKTFSERVQVLWKWTLRLSFLLPNMWIYLHSCNEKCDAGVERFFPNTLQNIRVNHDCTSPALKPHLQSEASDKWTTLAMLYTFPKSTKSWASSKPLVNQVFMLH